MHNRRYDRHEVSYQMGTNQFTDMVGRVNINFSTLRDHVLSMLLVSSLSKSSWARAQDWSCLRIQSRLQWTLSRYCLRRFRSLLHRPIGIGETPAKFWPKSRIKAVVDPAGVTRFDGSLWFLIWLFNTNNILCTIAFATVVTLEAAYNMKQGSVVGNYSEQQLVDCDTADSGCNGGYPTSGMLLNQS